MFDFNCPPHWKKIRFHYLFKIIGGCGFSVFFQGQRIGDYPFCKVSDISGEEKYLTTAKNYVDKNLVESEKYTVIPANAILISKIGEALKMNHRKINTVPCIIDNNCEAFVLKVPALIDFYYYYLLTVDMKFFDNGGPIPSINNTRLKNIPFPVPPLAEQEKIVRYLDKKTAQISTFLDAKKKEVALLDELKRSIIAEAVTKGLHNDISHWKFNRLKCLMTLHRGYDLTLTENITGEIPIYGSSGLMGYCQKETSKAPNIVIGRSGSTGKLHYIEKDFWAHNTGIFISDTKGNFVKYLYYLLNRVDMEQLSSKTAVPTLDRKKIQNYEMLFTTDLKEQKEIAAYLDARCEKIEKLIAALQEEIKNVEELKVSIISEVVTGKKDVRGLI